MIWSKHTIQAIHMALCNTQCSYSVNANSIYIHIYIYIYMTDTYVNGADSNNTQPRRHVVEFWPIVFILQMVGSMQ